MNTYFKYSIAAVAALFLIVIGVSFYYSPKTVKEITEAAGKAVGTVVEAVTPSTSVEVGSPEWFTAEKKTIDSIVKVLADKRYTLANTPMTFGEQTNLRFEINALRTGCVTAVSKYNEQAKLKTVVELSEGICG